MIQFNDSMKIVRGIRQFVSNSSVSVRALVVSIRGVSQFVSNSYISVRALVESIRALVEETKALTDDYIALLIKAAALWAHCRQRFLRLIYSPGSDRNYKQGARIGHLKLVILARLSQHPVNEWHNSLLVLRFWNENIKCLVFGCRQKIPTIKSKQKNLLLCRLLLIDLEWIEWLQENLRYKSHDLLPVFLPLETLLLCVFLNEKMQASKIHCWLIEITHDICKFFLHLQLLIRLFRFRSQYKRYSQLPQRFLRSFIQVVSMSFFFFWYVLWQFLFKK